MILDSCRKCNIAGRLEGVIIERTCCYLLINVLSLWDYLFFTTIALFVNTRWSYFYNLSNSFVFL